MFTVRLDYLISPELRKENVMRKPKVRRYGRYFSGRVQLNEFATPEIRIVVEEEEDATGSRASAGEVTSAAGAAAAAHIATRPEATTQA